MPVPPYGTGIYITEKDGFAMLFAKKIKIFQKSLDKPKKMW